MEPASSSDDESYASSNSSEDGNDFGQKVTAFKSLNDLPSDDSCADELDSSDDENSMPGYGDGNNEDNDEEMTLGQMIVKKRHEGRSLDKGRAAKNRKRAFETLARHNDSMSKQKGNFRAFHQSQEEDTRESKQLNNISCDNDRSNPSVDQSSSTKSERGKELVKNKKRSKHVPAEVSSKRKDFFQRGAPNLLNSGVASLGVRQYKPRDPRQQSLSGYFDENLFDQSYGFLEDIQNKEIEKLRENIAALQATGKSGQRQRKKLGLSGKDSETLQVCMIKIH